MSQRYVPVAAGWQQMWKIEKEFKKQSSAKKKKIISILIAITHILYVC